MTWAPSGTVSSPLAVDATAAVEDLQVELIGVRKEFGSRIVAVEGADLAVGDGELFAILGPSGSGKTTVLRMIAGFEQPTAGVIKLGGVDVTQRPARHRDVNTVFQEYALFPHMTVAQNVEYGLKVRGVAKAERRRRTADGLDMVRLTDQAHHRSEEHTSELQSQFHLVCGLLLEKKNHHFRSPVSPGHARSRMGACRPLRAHRGRAGPGRATSAALRQAGHAVLLSRLRPPSRSGD